VYYSKIREIFGDWTAGRSMLAARVVHSSTSIHILAFCPLLLVLVLLCFLRSLLGARASEAPRASTQCTVHTSPTHTSFFTVCSSRRAAAGGGRRGLGM
jgi:hypothetical protein